MDRLNHELWVGLPPDEELAMVAGAPTIAAPSPQQQPSPKTPLKIGGRSLVDGQPLGEESLTGDAGPYRFRAIKPATGEELEPFFLSSPDAWVDSAVEAACRGFLALQKRSVRDRAILLETIADELDHAHDALIDRGTAETGLGVARLDREFARMVGTLRLMGHLILDGSFARVSIDPPSPTAEPGSISNHDIRRMLVPVGPVAVFGASNFPLAYGVAGGDTASALAAGCSVVVKGHPAHPGVCEIIGRAIVRALERRNLDPGIFSLVQSGGEHEHEVGRRLVQHPSIRAVGFTGSTSGGMALVDAARARREPIPVFAEMGSANPVFVLPGAVESKAEEIADRLASSILESSGQQCTCPGIIFVVAGAGSEGGPGLQFLRTLSTRLDQSRDNVMLSRRVLEGYRARLNEVSRLDGVKLSAPALEFANAKPSTSGALLAPSTTIKVSTNIFREHDTLRDEIFGPAAVIVSCTDDLELIEASSAVNGSLTGSVFAAGRDIGLLRRILPSLQSRIGRLIFNGVPTGVRVCSSMVHGGPYPATNRPDTTAVGTFSIERWMRPLCFQNIPDALLPGELQSGNPLGIKRTETGSAVE